MLIPLVNNSEAANLQLFQTQRNHSVFAATYNLFRDRRNVFNFGHNFVTRHATISESYRTSHNLH